MYKFYEVVHWRTRTREYCILGLCTTVYNIIPEIAYYILRYIQLRVSIR